MLIANLRTNLRRALAEGSTRDAEEILHHLRSEDPLSLETRGFELELLLLSNRLREAQALARQLCHLFPGSPRVFSLAGKVAYRSKDYAEAEAHFRESHRIYPDWRTEHWIGKTLTQLGRFDEAEALLLSVKNRTTGALIDLAWLYERKNDLEAALQAVEGFLAANPGHPFATQQRMRIRAKIAGPDSLIEEIGTLEDLGEEVPPSLLPEYVRKLFETGQSPRAREAIASRIESLDPHTGSQIAWICYRAQAYDLACTLFLTYLRTNLSYVKYLIALESAARKCGRIPQVLEAYRTCLPDAPNLHGRCRTLARRLGALPGTGSSRQ
jgi:tetratricopeptide (TPR) repeat protein